MRGSNGAGEVVSCGNGIDALAPVRGMVRLVISLLIHAYLAPGVQDRIVDAVRRALP